jgi:excisionase family DNA binding protein
MKLIGGEYVKPFTIKQVKEMLDLSERTIFRLIKDGKLKGFKVGREWRFEQKDIDDYIAGQRAEAEREIRQKRKTDPKLPAVA